MCPRACVGGSQLFGPLQEPGWTDWPVRGRLPFTRPTQGGDGGGWSGVAQLRWSFRLLQEVHGAVLPTEHRGTDDRPHNYLPEILERVRLEDPLWKPAEVRRADYLCCLQSKRRKSEQNKQSKHMNMTWLQGAELTLTGLQTFSKQKKKNIFSILQLVRASREISVFQINEWNSESNQQKEWVVDALGTTLDK